MLQAVCQNNEVKCWDVVGGECGVVCEEALHKYPSARTFDVCRYPPIYICLYLDLGI